MSAPGFPQQTPRPGLDPSVAPYRTPPSAQRDTWQGPGRTCHSENQGFLGGAALPGCPVLHPRKAPPPPPRRTLAPRVPARAQRLAARPRQRKPGRGFRGSSLTSGPRPDPALRKRKNLGSTAPATHPSSWAGRPRLHGAAALSQTPGTP